MKIYVTVILSVILVNGFVVFDVVVLVAKFEVGLSL